MKLDEFDDVSKKFKEEMQQLHDDFNQLFFKWMKKSPKTTMLALVNMPLNMMLNLMEKSQLNFHLFLPNLPDAYIRMIAPFIKLKHEYGEISNKEFVKKYSKLYESQFDKIFEKEEEKDNFKKWFEGK